MCIRDRLKFGTTPALRPSRPLSSGPILFFAPGPIEWHTWHFLNTFAPFLTSCAKLAPVDVAINTAAAINFFISVSPFGHWRQLRRSVGSTPLPVSYTHLT